MVYVSIIIVIRMNENINNEYMNIIKIIMMYTNVNIYIYTLICDVDEDKLTTTGSPVC